MVGGRLATSTSSSLSFLHFTFSSTIHSFRLLSSASQHSSTSAIRQRSSRLLTISLRCSSCGSSLEKREVMYTVTALLVRPPSRPTSLACLANPPCFYSSAPSCVDALNLTLLDFRLFSAGLALPAHSASHPSLPSLPSPLPLI